MKIRKFKIGDLGKVLQIERAAFGPEAYSATTFLAHVFRDRKGFFVMEDSTAGVIGYVLIRLGLGWLGMKRGGITSIAVDPTHHRRGIGCALMTHTLHYLQEHQVEEADLEVAVDNHAAISLYEAFGFRRTKLLHHYYGLNRDGLKMVLALSAQSRAELTSIRLPRACEEFDPLLPSVKEKPVEPLRNE